MRYHKRTYWIVALVAVIALVSTAATISSGVTAPSGAGQIDDGAELLPQATISLEDAIAAAQAAADGALGEVDIEKYEGRLVFNVDVGDKDVKVDAENGAVLGWVSDD